MCQIASKSMNEGKKTRYELHSSGVMVQCVTSYHLEFLQIGYCKQQDFAIGAILGHQQDKHFHPIYYAS